ncbi:hypothetical protein M3Y94_00755300 [Aphelenchoides besseyi]|nr:hypothetical protein M3Y94_00755300 [Aphelenchoides besseyi]
MFGKKSVSLVDSSNKMSVNVIHKPSNSVLTTPWKSIFCVSIFTFCVAAQFTLFFTSLWPYLQIIDPDVSEQFYGLVIAIYSLGQLLSGPVVGYWSTKTRSIVRPAQCCLIMTLIGNIIYILVALLPTGHKWGILLARFFVGLGESSLSLYQGFSSTASVPNDRSRALSMTTGGLALGFCFGPGIQLFFSFIDYPGIPLIGRLSLNIYTAPAIFCCFINLFCIFGLRFIFVERYAGLANPDAKSKGEKKVVVPKYDRTAVLLCHFTRFTQLFCFTNIETLGSPFVMAMFAIRSADSVRILSICHSISGAIGFCIYMSHIFFKIDQRIDYRTLCILAFVGFIGFHVLTMPWPFVSGHLQTYSAEEYSTYLLSNGTKPEPVGCPKDVFSWCESTAPVNMWIYLIMPNINVSLSTILSKILGPRRQANQQSAFQMSASLARLTGPLAISYLYTEFGPLYAWTLELVVLCLMIAIWILQYSRFVPLQMPETEIEQPTVDMIVGPIDFADDDEEESKRTYERF